MTPWLSPQTLYNIRKSFNSTDFKALVYIGNLSKSAACLLCDVPIGHQHDRDLLDLSATALYDIKAHVIA